MNMCGTLGCIGSDLPKAGPVAVPLRTRYWSLRQVLPVAKRKPPKSSIANPAEALAQLETPRVKWKVIAQIGAGFGVLWVTALMTLPYIGYWGVGVVGVLTVLAAGFAIYAGALARRSRSIVNIMKTATDDQGREQALKQLAEGSSKDAMKALARAQLLAATDASQAIAILEGIDLDKAPAAVRDDGRTQLAMLYLRANRVRDARTLADAIRLDRVPTTKGKAMSAAIVAEAFSRTGKGQEALKLLQTYSADDSEYGEARLLLLRAQVFTYFSNKKRGLARKSMAAMGRMEPQMLGSFMQKGVPPELTRMAKQALAESGLAPKVRVKRAR
ncbi:MAG: hypothetical protein MJD61_19645 [Proteobacteria bacterium]|nr:hypothetical protein [Pseudomonadota bacterium]